MWQVRWEHTAELNVIEGQNELQVEIWDYNSISSNEFISAGRHSIIPATQKPGAYDAWVSLKDKKGRPGGELRIVLHFQSSGPAKQPAMAAPAPGVKYQPPGWNAAAAAGKMMAAPPPPQPQQYVPPPPAPLPQGLLHARSLPPPPTLKASSELADVGLGGKAWKALSWLRANS